MRTITALALVSLLGMTAHARTWTSADGTKTFEGEIREYSSVTGDVTVISNGRALTFPQTALSQDDISFLEEWETAASAPSPMEQVSSTEVGAKVAKAKLHRLDGKRYRDAELTKAPEYYILYYSASW